MCGSFWKRITKPWPLPGGGHTAFLVMITGVPKLQDAAAAVRWTSAGPFKPLVPQLPVHGGPGTAYSLPQSRKGSALHLFPRKQYGPQKEQSDLGLNFCSKSVSLPLIRAQLEMRLCHLNVAWPLPSQSVAFANLQGNQGYLLCPLQIHRLSSATGSSQELHAYPPRSPPLPCP